MPGKFRDDDVNEDALETVQKAAQSLSALRVLGVADPTETASETDAQTFEPKLISCSRSN